MRRKTPVPTSVERGALYTHIPFLHVTIVAVWNHRDELVRNLCMQQQESGSRVLFESVVPTE